MPNELLMGLLPYWPEQAQVLDVIKTQAEGLSTPLLLAVHQPMDFSVLDADGRSVGYADQESFFDRLLQDHPDGYRIVPLIGPPGVGKSHAIKWVDARLKELPDSDRYHVVRVQKGASLRSVLEKVAAGLEGPAYERFTRRIQEAQEGLTEKQLFWALTGELSEELENPGEWVSNSPDLKESHECWQEGLRAFLGDHVVRTEYLKKFEKSPLALLARRIHEGIHPDEVGSEGRRQEFLPDDFLRAQDAVHPVLNRLSTDAEDFFRALNDRTRVECARLLNEALDPATSRLLKFRGGELEGLFVEVRQQLQREGKEWVLLLEDLTALSGIRTALFNIMVRGKDAQDEHELCTIRSVLAATPGHVRNIGGPWDTVISRAERVFTMDSRRPNEEEHIEKAVGLVGAYLNAVRIGRASLEEAFLWRTDEGPWLQNLGDLEQAQDVKGTLESFGRSSGGHHLFPLNRHAIKQRILSEYRKGDGLLQFTPREVIGSLVRDTLNRRAEFEAGSFPSELFGKEQLRDERLVVDVSQRVGEGISPARHLRVLAYWGDQPRSAGEAARLPSPVYEAFGLTPLDFGEPLQVETPPGSGVEPVVRPLPTDPWIESRDRWKKVLTDWRTGQQQLGQLEARSIRNAVLDGILKCIPAGWPGLPRVDSRQRKKALLDNTFLPRTATGSGSKAGDLENAAVVICTEADLRDEKKAAEITLDLLMVVLFHDVAGGFWEVIDRIDEFEFPRYSRFVHGHRAGLVSWLRSQYALSPTSRTFQAVVEGRLLSAAALGFPGTVEGASPSKVNDLFWLGGRNPVGRETKWELFLFAAKEFQATTQAVLEESFCSFQGLTGRTPYAVDSAYLMEWADSLEVGKLGRGIPQGENHPDLMQSFKALKTSFNPGFDEREQELADWAREARAFLDQDFLREFRELLDLATAANLDLDQDGSSLTKRVRDGIDGLPHELRQVVEELTGLKGLGSKVEKLAVMARVEQDLIVNLKRVFSDSRLYLDLVEPRARQRAQMLEGDDAEASLKDLNNTVKGIETILAGGKLGEEPDAD